MESGSYTLANRNNTLREIRSHHGPRGADIALTGNQTLRMHIVGVAGNVYTGYVIDTDGHMTNQLITLDMSPRLNRDQVTLHSRLKRK
ncbi:MAG TPA: hypothetical protein VF597_04275 [Candidatus Saccharimonadales bacterium]|jgi:hypothetical protein